MSQKDRKLHGKQVAKLRLTPSGSRAQPLDGIPTQVSKELGCPKGTGGPEGGGERARLERQRVREEDAGEDKARAAAAPGMRGQRWNVSLETQTGPFEAQVRVIYLFVSKQGGVGDLGKLRSI